MTFLIILAAIICLLAGFIAGLILVNFIREEETLKEDEAKRTPKSESVESLKKFFNYDGTAQE